MQARLTISNTVIFIAFAIIVSYCYYIILFIVVTKMRASHNHVPGAYMGVYIVIYTMCASAEVSAMTGMHMDSSKGSTAAPLQCDMVPMCHISIAKEKSADPQ